MSYLAVCGLLLNGCRLFADSDFPVSATPIAPPPQYQAWWQVVESCAGKRAPFDAVSWYSVPPGELIVSGETAAGTWFVSGNRIVITAGRLYAGPLVRHEMLHAILHTGGHPQEFFRGKCTDEVICGRDCETPIVLPTARELAVDVLEVDAVLHPSAVSLSQHEGKATVVVRLRNPTSENMFLPPELFGEAQCVVGFMVSAVSDPGEFDIDCGSLAHHPTDGRVYFRPGETRRLLFEVDLRVTYGRPLRPGPVTVSAILLDQVRGTSMARVLP